MQSTRRFKVPSSCPAKNETRAKVLQHRQRPTRALVLDAADRRRRARGCRCDASLSDCSGKNTPLRWGGGSDGIIRRSSAALSGPSGFSRAKRRLDEKIKELTKGEPLERWTFHDRTTATGLEKLHFSLPVTEAVLNQYLRQ
jgi:hypothetical protein